MSAAAKMKNETSLTGAEDFAVLTSRFYLLRITTQSVAIKSVAKSRV